MDVHPVRGSDIPPESAVPISESYTLNIVATYFSEMSSDIF